MALVKFAPSILAADCWQLGKQIKEAEQAGADLFPIGVMMSITVFAGIAEFERELIRESTRAGREVAKRHGVQFGRPTKMDVEQKDLAAHHLAREGQ